MRRRADGRARGRASGGPPNQPQKLEQAVGAAPQAGGMQAAHRPGAFGHCQMSIKTQKLLTSGERTGGFAAELR